MPVSLGPPIPQSPWRKMVPPFTASPPPVPPDQRVEMQPVTIGPTIGKAPWFRQAVGLLRRGPIYPGTPPRAPGLSGAALLQRLIPRDPQADPRSRPHQDHVAALLNSLLRQEEIVQSGQSDWVINPDDGGVRQGAAPSDGISAADRGKLIVYNSTLATAVGLPHVDLVDDHFWVELMNLGTGVVTVRPDVGTINGLGFIQLTIGQSMRVYCDGVTYWAATSRRGGATWQLVV